MSAGEGTAAAAAAAAPEVTPEQGSAPVPVQPDAPALADDADGEPDGGWIVFDNAAGERERVSLIEYRERGL